MLHSENFTGIVDSIFDQRACFVVVFEKLRMHVPNVSDEVLQTNHDVDIESNRVESPDRRKEWPPVSEKGTVRKVDSMSNTHLQEPGYVVCVLHRDDAKSQQNDFSESSFGTEDDGNTVIRMTLIVEAIYLQNRQGQHILKFCNGKTHEQSAEQCFCRCTDRVIVRLESSRGRRVFMEELFEMCRELVVEKL